MPKVGDRPSLVEEKWISPTDYPVAESDGATRERSLVFLPQGDHRRVFLIADAGLFQVH
jgi:hypothetical protein